MSKGLKPMWVILEEKIEGKEHVTLVARKNICQSYTVNRKEISQCPNGDVGQRKLFSVSYWRYKTVRILKKEREREREKNVCILIGNIHLPLLCGHGWIPMYPASSCFPFSIPHVPKDGESVHFTVFNTNKDWSTRYLIPMDTESHCHVIIDRDLVVTDSNSSTLKILFKC